ncbi:MAG: alanine:cation symporter family protein [Alphaproteobacteria bacterium]|nr:alanine:cation symporter family protein [Alphaproteobacteria bacterium]
MSIDQWIDEKFVYLSEVAGKTLFYGIDLGVVNADGVAVEAPLILIWLAAAGVFFTGYLGFINLRYFKHAWQIVFSRKFDEPGADGAITSFQALATSLSGTVGLGNIAGVAVAVSVGGPGAVFWMVVMGFMGMSTKFAEVTMGLKYRKHCSPGHPDKISGGPMYYLKDAFTARNMPMLGSFMAALFAVFCIFGSIGGGNMFQSNQSFVQLVEATGGVDGSWLADKGWLYGLVLAALTGAVIIGGIKTIARAASKIVPVMGLVYLLACLIVILANITDLPAALMTIVTQAFAPAAGIGGVLGGLLVGVQRASFSNEAGLGSAAIVHCEATTDYPVRQGLASMLGPFFDTIVICMATALMIVLSGVYVGGQGMEGVALTNRAMSSVIPGAEYVLALTVFLFAFSTLITWGYLGVKATTFLFGEKDWIELAFKLIFCGFVVVGAAANMENVIGFSDALILSMAIPNLVGLYVMAPELKKDLKNYLQMIKADK